MDIGRLREYIELSKCLNFTAAARAMHISQPALSNHIRSLEREVRATLVERPGASPARLTPAGQRFLDMAKEIVEAHDRGMADIEGLRQAIVGKVKVRMPRREYGRPLLDYVYEFHDLHPNIEMILVPWVAEDGLVDVASGKVDCAFIGQTPGYEEGETGIMGVGQVSYARAEACLWIDASHPLAQVKGLHATDLADCHLVIPANQKNESWTSLMRSISDEIGVDLAVEEKYCDSLEDLLVNKLGPNDVVLNTRELFNMPGISSRPGRLVRAFTPPLMTRSTLAYSSDMENEALCMFVSFLRGKCDQEARVS